MFTKKNVFFHLLFVCLPAVALAQNGDATSIYTPYSFYGVGDLAATGFSFQRGMGGAGVGLRTGRVINIMNPAALSAQDTLSFMFDFGAEMQNYYLSSAGGNSAGNSANIDHLSLSFPVWRKTVVALSVLPYSYVGYKVTQKETNPDMLVHTGDVTYTNQGDGGFNQLLLSLGYSFGRLSVGGQAAYIFGAINRYSNSSFNTASGFAPTNSGVLLRASNFGAGLGVQYEQPLSPSRSLTFGATWQFKQQMKIDRTDFAFAVRELGTDTVRYSVTDDARLLMPAQLGIGVTYREGNRWLAGIDYAYRDWTGADFQVAALRSFQAKPEHIFRGGLEITPNRNDIRYLLKRWSYRAGLFYQKTYMQFDHHRVDNYGITFGVGIPIGNMSNSVNLAAELGQRGSTANGLICERYWKLSLSVSLYDLWFMKQQYQ